MKISKFLPVLCAFLMVAGTAHAAPLKIVASFSILRDLTAQIAGDKAEISSLVGPDEDAHVFQPKPADAKKIAEAQLVIVNGLGFEGWLDRLVQSSGGTATIVIASKGIHNTLAMDDEHHPGHGLVTDPHAWQSIANGERYVANIAQALEKADPANAAYYEARAVVLLKELTALDGWVRAEINKIPAAKRKVITSHDAFGYFSRSYGVLFTAPVGMNTEAEATAKDLKRLIAQIITEGTRAIFIENMSNPRLVEQLAKEGRAVIGGKLYADALSAPDGPAPTYQSMFRYNVKSLADAMRQNP